ncbi:cathelicidin-1-like [Hyperolius riggenbachi]|uniref:cathelicidin-1-like n=1 Tax=Hyperolius riggenbachi TaxID=752182 RepID=UPI0035A2DBBD
MRGSCWWGVLVLAAVSSQLGLCQLQEPDILEEVSLTEMVEMYNQREEEECYYKLLTGLPVTELEEEEDSPTVAFLIKETECLKSGRDIDLERCDYKEDGEVKVCGMYPDEDGKSEEELRCVSLTQNVRAKRAANPRKCNNFLCRMFRSRTGRSSHIAKGSTNRGNKGIYA